jgi:hypothetical protein
MSRRLTRKVVNDRLIDRGFHLIEEYTDARSIHKFFCSSCNHVFESRPYNLFSGKGCARCSGLKKLTKEIVNRRLLNTNYQLIGDYKNARSLHDFSCSSCDGEFKSRPYDLFKGKGCPKCANHGFDPTKPACLYYIKINDNGALFYKIGITNRSVYSRFYKEDLNKITILRVLDFESGKKARELEQYYVKLFSKYVYDGDKLLKSVGNTEIFTIDVFCID